jgi:beta-galactosidase
LKADGADATLVTVQVLDAKGRLVPTAQHGLEFSIEGPAEIIGLGNGNPNSHEPEKGTRRSLFNGLAQVIVQSKFGVTGEVKLKVQGKGLAPFELKLMVE